MENIAYVTSAVTALLAAASLLLAFTVYRLQKRLTMPKIVLFSDLIEKDDTEVYGLFVQNVGHNPALNIRLKVEIDEWGKGRRLPRLKEWDAYGDAFIVLQPQEQRVYELPTLETSYIVTAKVSSSNCPSDTVRFSVGDDPGALHEVLGDKMDISEVILDAKAMKNHGKLGEDEPDRIR